MEINTTKMLDDLLETAKKKRASIPYSEDEAMPNMLVFVGQNGEVESTPVTWQDEHEKHIKMQAVSKIARKLMCPAVISINDTRWTNSDKFGEYFHIPSIKEIGIEKWQKEYASILWGTYGGLIKNLPREVWMEAVLVVIKGPRIPVQSRMAPYIEGPNDTVQFVEHKKLEQDLTHWNLLPDWWM